MLLPGDTSVASVAQTKATWIVAGRPGPQTARVARRFGAQPLLQAAGIFRVRRAQAREFAGALRAEGELSFAEPDALTARNAFPSDPLSGSQYVYQVVHPSLTPPAPTTDTTIAVIDEQVDVSHPELSSNVRSVGSRPIRGAHGTAVASVAAAPANGIGLVGVWPGAKVLAYDPGDACGATTRAVARAVAADVTVINMSYGFAGRGSCFSHTVATQYAYSQGVTLVAASGNEFEEGNPRDRYPAADPHVLTVAAVNPKLDHASFSSSQTDVDLAAPGVGILTAVPPALDDDGNGDGYLLQDGTSFSAPMVAGGTAWVAEARPGLDHTQLFQVMRTSARDLGRRGFDRTFGFGLLRVGAALREPAPPRDPSEPNDDIPWVDGTRFEGADRPIFSARSRRRTLRARVDITEDPADVYRVVLPARSALRFSVRPEFGDPDLVLLRRSAKSAFGRRGVLARSRRADGRDRVTLVNDGPKRIVYASVYVEAGDGGYRLEVARVRR